MLDPTSVPPGSAPSPASTSEPADKSVRPKSHASGLARYGAAVGVVVVAFVLRGALFGELNNRLPFAFFLPAAMIAAWYGGFGPGLLAAAAGLLLGDYFFLPPHQAGAPLGEAERTAITVYAITSTLAVTLIENLHGRIRRLKGRLGQKQAAAPKNTDDRPAP